MPPAWPGASAAILWLLWAPKGQSLQHRSSTGKSRPAISWSAYIFFLAADWRTTLWQSFPWHEHLIYLITQRLIGIHWNLQTFHMPSLFVVTSKSCDCKYQSSVTTSTSAWRVALGCCRKRLTWPVTVKTLNGLLGHNPLELECARDMKNSLYARSNNLHISDIYVCIYIYYNIAIAIFWWLSQ